MSSSDSAVVVSPPTNQLEEIQFGAGALFSHRQLVEVRAMMRSGYWRGFYFTNHQRMAEAVLKLDQNEDVKSLYYVFNVINPRLLEKRLKCKCEKCSGGLPFVENPTDEQITQILDSRAPQHLTGDEDIIALRWLFIDVDTVRAKGMEHESASKTEKAVSREVANMVMRFLEQHEWPTPLMADSGNGFHILPRLNDLPNLESNVSLLTDCLSILSRQFDCSAAKIDNSVFNPARLTRAYGTTTRKGTDTNERPYRRNRVKNGATRRVTMDQVIDHWGEKALTRKPRGDMPVTDPEFDPQKFFDWYESLGAFSITNTTNTKEGELHVTDICITHGAKHTGSILTGFIIGDTFGYHCFSDSCTGITIGDVLQKLGEDYPRYPGPIWPKDDDKHLDFADDATLEDGYTLAKKKDEEDEADFLEAEEIDELEETASPPKDVAPVEHSEACPPATPMMKFCPACGRDLAKAGSERFVGKEPNELAERMMAVMLRKPKEVYSDFILFKQRFNKLAKHFSALISVAFTAILDYEEEIRHLPDLVELKDYINHHPAAKHYKKKELCDFIDTIVQSPTWTFDVTALALLEEVEWRLERKALMTALAVLEKERDIPAGRTIIRKQWAGSMAIDSDFRPGVWQENTEKIAEDFRRKVAGEVDSRKFKTGFAPIDNGDTNIGLDGEHAIVLFGPAANRKTNLAMTLALNFAREGKHGLFLAGEHKREKIESRLTIMFSHYMRDIVGVVPNLNKWEGINRTATYDDYDRLNQVLMELKTMRMVPGFLEVQNIGSLTRGEEDVWGAIESYADATYKKYQWDFLIIDPLDSVLPIEGTTKNHYQSCAAVVDRMFEYSRSFAGDRGLMLVTTAQFKAEARRAIEKVQTKNAGGLENFDDEITDLLGQDSQIQYIGNKLTQRFDRAFGVACRVKGGNEGMIVAGRSREGGSFKSMDFICDLDSNVVLEKTKERSQIITSGEAVPLEKTMPQDMEEEIG